MFISVTWTQFGAIISVAVVLYYLFVLLKYFWLEIKRLFDPPKRAAESAPPAGHAFGAVQYGEEEMNLVDENELRFAEPEPDEVKTELLGGIADFMHELNALLRVATTKDEFLFLLSMLAGKYPNATAIRYAEPIALHILEEGASLPFSLTKDEIENALIPENNEN